MSEAVLVIIKPDGLQKGLMGPVLSEFSRSGLNLVGIKVIRPDRDKTEEHYQHIKGKPFFEEVIEYFTGKLHNQKDILAVVYYGENAIEISRTLAGATNPELADPRSLRGAFGRITTKGVFENVVHVSSDKEEAEREIKLWFKPDELVHDVYPSKIADSSKQDSKVWQ